MSSIFDYINSFKEVDRMVEEGEVGIEEAFDTLDALDMSIDDKLEGYAQFIKGKTAEAEAIKAEEKILAQRRKVKENTIESAKRRLTIAMNDMGKSKFETAKCRISFRKSEAVEIKDESSFIEWAREHAIDCLTFKDPTINKTELKKALKEGNGEELCNYASIVEKQNIQIK